MEQRYYYTKFRLQHGNKHINYNRYSLWNKDTILRSSGYNTETNLLTLLGIVYGTQELFYKDQIKI